MPIDEPRAVAHTTNSLSRQVSARGQHEHIAAVCCQDTGRPQGHPSHERANEVGGRDRQRGGDAVWDEFRRRLPLFGHAGAQTNPCRRSCEPCDNLNLNRRHCRPSAMPPRPAGSLVRLFLMIFLVRCRRNSQQDCTLVSGTFRKTLLFYKWNF